MGYRQRMMLFLCIDAVIVYSTVLISYLLRFDGNIPAQYVNGMHYLSSMMTFMTICVFMIRKLYNIMWEYAGINELVSLVRETTTSMVLVSIICLLLRLDKIGIFIPFSVILITWISMTVAMGGCRMLIRIIREEKANNQLVPKKKTLIVGAGRAGALVVREIKNDANSDTFIVGIIDDDPNKQKLKVGGIPVIGGRNDIPQLVEQHDIDSIIIAIPSAPKKEIAEIINICKGKQAHIKILPYVSDVIRGKVTVNHIRDVNVEDLLGRDPVAVDLNGITDYIKDRVILVTGAGGSIGSELCRQIATFSPKKLLLLGHGENSIFDIEMELRRVFPNLKLQSLIADVKEKRRMKQIFSEFSPDVVFHAAAHKHVPLMEDNPIEAIKNNVIGTKVVAECADEFRASHFVLISTDKAVNPTSIMGVTKRIAEMIVQTLDRKSATKFVAVRFGNVLGSRGSAILVFKQQIKMGGPVTVTHPDMVRYFMTIPEAVQLVIQAGSLAVGGEIFILDMGEPVKIYDLARDLIRLSGLEPEKDIKIAFTGIRPGEKLFEEILMEDEGAKSTKHNRIYIGKPIHFSFDDFMSFINQLEELSRKESPVNHEEVKRVLRKMVTTYQVNSAPQNIKKYNNNEKVNQREMQFT